MAVIGGGPAGMKAAEIAARRGHEVTLIEKGDALGGQVLIAAKVPMREEFRGIVRYLNTQLSKLPVHVVLNTAATADSILAMNPDAVVVATGSTPRTLGYQNIRPDITAHPGVSQENVMSSQDAIQHPERVGRKVLLVDDGESNWKVLSTAVYLAEQGKQVEIITSLFYAGARIGANSIGILYGKLFSLGVKLTSMTGFLGIAARPPRCSTASRTRSGRKTTTRLCSASTTRRRTICTSPLRARSRSLSGLGIALPRGTHRRPFARANWQAARSDGGHGQSVSGTLIRCQVDMGDATREIFGNIPSWQQTLF